MVEQVWCVPGKSPMVKITMYDITLEIAEPVINPVIPALKFLLSQMTCYKKKSHFLIDGRTTAFLRFIQTAKTPTF